MNTRHTRPWAIVAKREIMVLITDKTFWISTLTTIALMVVGVTLAMLLGGAQGAPSKIAVSTDDAAAAVAMANQTGANVEALRVPEAELTSAVEKDQAVASLQKDATGWVLTLKPAMSGGPQLERGVREYQLQQNAERLGVDPGAIVEGTSLRIAPLNAGDDDGIAIMIASLAFTILFMMSALTFGYQIAQSVVTEKESRIVEILAATIPIRQLLIGKVVGNTIMALGQVVLFVTVALVGLSFTEFRPLIGLIAPVAGWFVLFFLVGFASLACLWAAAGAMATRMQDIGQTTTPLMILIMGVYMAGFMASGVVAKVLSFVPIASTVLMPGRLLNGDAQWWEAIVALCLAVVFMAGAIWAGSRIYRRGLMQTGSVMTLRQAFSKAS